MSGDKIDFNSGPTFLYLPTDLTFVLGKLIHKVQWVRRNHLNIHLMELTRTGVFPNLIIVF